MKQLVYIHGGCTFPDNDTFCRVLETRDYKSFENKNIRISRLHEKLESKYEFFKPEMPNKYNANYKAWKIWFEKTLPYLNNEDLVLIGHSQGGMFLIKYIGENGFPKKIAQLHLVSSIFDESDMDEDIKYSGDFLYNPDIINNIENYADKIFLYHSTDDNIVPYSHAEKIKSYLTNAKLITLTDRCHITQAEFPELLANILK